MIQNFHWRHSLILVSFLFLQCGKGLPEFSGIDLNQWKNDAMGCSGFRKQVTDTLATQKDKLLGLSEMEIISLLGRPDENELYKRNQKFYHYYLTPSSGCEAAEPKSVMLHIRFNAMGLAKEVAVNSDSVDN